MLRYLLFRDVCVELSDIKVWESFFENNPSWILEPQNARLAEHDVNLAKKDLLPVLDFDGSFKYQSVVPEFTIDPVQVRHLFRGYYF